MDEGSAGFQRTWLLLFFQALKWFGLDKGGLSLGQECGADADQTPSREHS